MPTYFYKKLLQIFAAKIHVFLIQITKNQKNEKNFRLTNQALEVLKTPEVKLQLMLFFEKKTFFSTYATHLLQDKQDKRDNAINQRGANSDKQDKNKTKNEKTRHNDRNVSQFCQKRQDYMFCLIS